MRRFLSISILSMAAIVSFSVLLLYIPNPLGKMVVEEAKAKGYLSYTPEEATKLAYKRCTACHDEVKILKYCSRCGPPFIVVTNFMKKYIEMARQKGLDVKQFSDAEIVAITQVWNALVGNWEGDWPKKDIEKLLGNNEALLHLLNTPQDKRPIEAALKIKSAPGSYKEYQDKYGVAGKRL